LRNSTPELLRVAIIGGGLAGLTTAYELVRRTRIDFLPLEIRLYEAENRLGGTIRTEAVRGFRLEHGADSISTVNTAGLRLVVELNLQSELIPAHIERGVVIWWDDRCHPMPPGLSRLGGSTLRALRSNTLLSAGGKLRVGLERFAPRRPLRSEETIEAFVARRFGRQMLERVGDPLLAGLLCGDPAELSVDYTFPDLVRLERRHGSVSKGLRRSAGERNGSDPAPFPGVPRKITRSPAVSFRNGMQTLVDAVAGAIRRSDTEALHVGRRVTRLRPMGDPLGAAAYAVDTDDGESWVADICVLALPGRVGAKLLEPFAPEVSEALAGVPHASSLAVYLGYDRPAVKRLPETMGCLVPHSQGRPSWACALVHQEFAHRAPPGGGLLCVQMGGARQPSLVDWGDDAAIRVARKEASTLFGVHGEPTLARVLRRPRAHPQYVVGHGKRIEAVEREIAFHSGLLIAGSSLYGVTVPEIIDNGRATAAVVSDLARTRLA
jgi:oxygen-dependent protoporphyrinogen oxidase